MKLLSSTLNLLNEVELTEGEITPEVESKLISLSKQVDQAGYFLKNVDKKIEYYQQEIDAMKTIIDRLEKTSDWIKASAKQAIELSGGDLKGDLYAFTLKKNPPRVHIRDEALIDDFFKDKKELVTVNKTRIKEAFKDGLEVDGAELVQETSVKLTIFKKQIEE